MSRAVASPLVAALFLAGCGRPELAERPMLGTLERDRYELVAEVREPIVARPVREGQTVERGTLVVGLDPERAVAAREAAASRVERATARLAELRRGGRSEARDEARAQIEVERAALAQAELDETRARNLVAQGVSAQARLDAAETASETARARLEAARARLETLVQGATREELEQAESDLEAAKADLEAAELEVARREIRAPVKGRIDALPYELGEQPPPGAAVAVLLGGPAWARIYVPEPFLARLGVGAAVEVRYDGDGDGDGDGDDSGGAPGPLAGCLRFVASEATFTPHYALSEHDRHRLAYLAEIEILDGAETLPTGLPVRVFAAPEDGDLARRCRERFTPPPPAAAESAAP